MPGVVPVRFLRGVRHFSLGVDVWISMKHTYHNARSQQYAGDPEFSIMQSILCLMCLYFPSA